MRIWVQIVLGAPVLHHVVTLREKTTSGANQELIHLHCLFLLPSLYISPSKNIYTFTARRKGI